MGVEGPLNTIRVKVFNLKYVSEISNDADMHIMSCV